LKNEKALLNNFDIYSVANEFLLLFDNHLTADRTDEVINAVEVVEPIKGRESTPVVE